MSDPQLFSTFYLGLGIAVVVILVAAVLLILTQRAAQRILDLAIAALGLVNQIKANTMIVWALQDTNKAAVEILESAESIRDHGALVATALHEIDVKRGAS